MTSRSAWHLARLSQRLLCPSSRVPASFINAAQQSTLFASIAGDVETTHPCTRGFAAEATPSKIDKPSGQETGHDSPYSKPKAGQEAQGSATEIPWDPEHVNIGNECDKILLHAAEKDGVPGILKEIEMHGLTFNDNNIATAFEQLAQQRESLPDERVQSELFDRTPFKQLVEMAKSETENFNPRQLADITASLGKLKFQDAGLLANLISRTATKVSEMDSDHLSKLSDGLAGSTAAGLSDLYKTISKKK